jgi:hypothetical protein
MKDQIAVERRLAARRSHGADGIYARSKLYATPDTRPERSGEREVLVGRRGQPTKFQIVEVTNAFDPAVKEEEYSIFVVEHPKTRARCWHFVRGEVTRIVYSEQEAVAACEYLLDNGTLRGFGDPQGKY